MCAKKIIPQNLAEEQRKARKSVSSDVSERVENNPDLLNGVVTGDESWFFQCDPETRRQSSQWCSNGLHRPKKKIATSMSKVKCMLCVLLQFQMYLS